MKTEIFTLIAFVICKYKVLRKIKYAGRLYHFGELLTRSEYLRLPTYFNKDIQALNQPILKK